MGKGCHGSSDGFHGLLPVAAAGLGMNSRDAGRSDGWMASEGVGNSRCQLEIAGRLAAKNELSIYIAPQALAVRKQENIKAIALGPAAALGTANPGVAKPIVPNSMDLRSCVVIGLVL